MPLPSPRQSSRTLLSVTLESFPGTAKDDDRRKYYSRNCACVGIQETRRLSDAIRNKVQKNCNAHGQRGYPTKRSTPKSEGNRERRKEKR